MGPIRSLKTTKNHNRSRPNWPNQSRPNSRIRRRLLQCYPVDEPDEQEKEEEVIGEKPDLTRDVPVGDDPDEEPLFCLSLKIKSTIDSSHCWFIPARGAGDLEE